MAKIQTTILTILRVALGWHLFYEGITKILSDSWSSATYLVESKWIFSGFFQWIAQSPDILNIVDILNAWILCIAGLMILFGLLTRVSALISASLILLYYLANPPFVGYPGVTGEGTYLIINKNLIEVLSLAVFIFIPKNSHYSFDRLLNRIKQKKEIVARPRTASEKADTGKSLIPQNSASRREVLKDLVSLPLFGGLLYAFYRKSKWDSLEEKYLLENQKTDAITSATIKRHQFSDISELKGKPGKGKIGETEISRLILGGNLIGGWAHARDLLYVSKLVKAYNTEKRVMQTFELAEACGVNTLLTNPQLCSVINKYWHRHSGNIQFISDCGISDDLLRGIQVSVDGGASLCYIQGEIADRMVENQKFDDIQKAIDMTRENGLKAGIGAHKIETIKACTERGILPDFWVKTLHHHNYWSATPNEWNDNRFCFKPEETISFMNGLDQPWIAFKVLAAGALSPQDGFRYAFENGADFICVGMYDFQIVEDVNIVHDVFKAGLERKRPWKA